jgi:sugar lactone lactonase YvrE
MPPPTPLEGPLAPNQLITDGEIYAADQLEHPEDITDGLDGHLYTGTGGGYSGTSGGGIWRLETEGVAVTRVEQVATVPGSVLGMRPYSEDILVAAVVGHGVMAIDTTSGDSWVLSDRIDGNLVYFPDGLDIAEDGTIYYTEASTLYYPGFPYDMLDGRPRGRLLRYEPSTGETDVVAEDLYFANGVAVDPEETHALVAESWRYRITRVELGGDDEGTTSQFGPDLAAIPDNLRLDDQGRLWVGGSGIRSDVIDTLMTSIDLRRQLLSMSLEELRAIQDDNSGNYGFAQVLSPEGEPVFSFHDPTEGFDVSALLSHDGFVTFGTVTSSGVVRIPVPAELT